MEIWGVYTGSETSLEPSQIDSLWSSEELARKYVAKQVKLLNLISYRELYPKSRNVIASPTWGLNTFGDGDYFIFATKLTVDNPDLMEDL